MTEKDTASWLTIFKEVAAAVLGGIIIVLTLVLMWPLLSKATPDLTSAQGIFAILGGWGGIIIGYYFGRLPSEKAADTANKVANTANKVAIEANQASTTAKQTADDAVQTKLRVVSDCTNLLENTAKSLKELSGSTTDSKIKKGLSAAESLDNVTVEIEAQIQKIDAEIQKLGSIG